MNDATLPWTVSDLFFIFKSTKNQGLTFLFKLVPVPMLWTRQTKFWRKSFFLPAPAKISGSTTMAAKIKRIGSRQVASLHCTGMQCCWFGSALVSRIQIRNFFYGLGMAFCAAGGGWHQQDWDQDSSFKGTNKAS